jgi:hypothetical protein
VHTIVNLAELTNIATLNYEQDPPYLNKYEYDSCDEPIRPNKDSWTTRICPVKIVEKFDASDIFSEPDLSFTTSKKSLKSSSVTNTKMSFQSKLQSYIYSSNFHQNKNPLIL